MPRRWLFEKKKNRRIERMYVYLEEAAVKCLAVRFLVIDYYAAKEERGYTYLSRLFTFNKSKGSADVASCVIITYVYMEARWKCCAYHVYRCKMREKGGEKKVASYFSNGRMSFLD